MSEAVQELPEGVSWHPGIRLWRADITVGGKQRYVGSCTTVTAASELYQTRMAEELKKGPQPVAEPEEESE